MNQKELDERKKKAERQAELQKLQPITFDALTKTIHHWMLVADTGIVKLLPAILVANKLSRDPIWIFLIAPSGGGKSELMTMMLEWPDMYRVSTVTPNTFLSGMPGIKDPGLLFKVDGKVLAFLDWTNMLAINKDARNEIMGQLRDIYGGHVTKIFGTGKEATWDGKIGIVACTTSIVDFSQQQNAALGERFIHYRMKMPDAKSAARRAFKNGSHQEEMRKALSGAFYSFMKGITLPEEPPELPAEVEEELITVANFATKARSGVIREFGMKKEMIFVPASEMPTRLTQQLKTLAIAMMIVNGGTYEENDMNIIYRIALDSIPETNYMAMKEMARADERTTADIAASVDYPTSTIRQYLENLTFLKVAKRVRAADSEQGGTADRWTLAEEFVEILKKYEEIKVLEKEVIMADPEMPALESEPEIKSDTLFNG